MRTKICAQQQSKITRERIGHSRDGNEWDLEFVIKPSQSQQGAHLPCFTLSCSPVLPHPVGYGAAEGQKGWGATAVECTRDTKREQGKQERRRCWGGDAHTTQYPPAHPPLLPKNEVSGSNSPRMLWSSLVCCSAAALILAAICTSSCGLTQTPPACPVF